MIYRILDDFIETSFFGKFFIIIILFGIFYFSIFALDGAITIMKDQNETEIDIKRSAIINQSQQIHSAFLLNEALENTDVKHLHNFVEREILNSVPVFENTPWRLENSKVSLLIENAPLCESINKRYNDPIEKWDTALRCDRITNDFSKIFILKI